MRPDPEAPSLPAFVRGGRHREDVARLGNRSSAHSADTDSAETWLTAEVAPRLGQRVKVEVATDSGWGLLIGPIREVLGPRRIEAAVGLSTPEGPAQLQGPWVLWLELEPPLAHPGSTAPGDALATSDPWRLVGLRPDSICRFCQSDLTAFVCGVCSRSRAEPLDDHGRSRQARQSATALLQTLVDERELELVSARALSFLLGGVAHILASLDRPHQASALMRWLMAQPEVAEIFLDEAALAARLERLHLDEDVRYWLLQLTTASRDDRTTALQTLAMSPTGDARVRDALTSLLEDRTPCVVQIPYRYGELRYLAGLALVAELRRTGDPGGVRLRCVVPRTIEELEAAQAATASPAIATPDHDPADHFARVLRLFAGLRDQGVLAEIEVDLATTP